MDQIKGAQSIMFREAPYLISAASVAGSKEADGPIGKLFDVTDKDDLFGAQTWEEAESNMQKEACVLAAGKAHVDLKKIRYLFGGDLLRQGIATSMGVEALQIPMFGLYGACSTSGEALALASMSAAAGYGGTMIAVTSSHFGSAEKEFRFPLGYANQRPLSSHWTVTGSGAFLVQSAEEYRKQNTKSYFSNIRITGVTVGKIVDYGLKDSQNMGGGHGYDCTELPGYGKKRKRLRQDYYRRFRKHRKNDFIRSYQRKRVRYMRKTYGLRNDDF